MEICKVCGNDFQRMDIHVMKKHKMKMEAYNLLPSYIDAGKENIVEKVMDVAKNDNPILDDLGDEDGFEELDTMNPIGEPEVIEVAKKVTPKDKKDGIWGGNSEGKLLSDFLKEYNLNETELRSMLTDKMVKTVPTHIQIENREKSGRSIALTLKDNSKVTTNNIVVADSLVQEFGFICKEVKGPNQFSKVKTWVLEKNI